MLIGQTPNLPGHTPDCLADNPNDVEKCGMSLDEAIQPSVRQGEAAAAAALGWTYVDPSVWLCAHDCPPLAYSTLLYMDDHHVTVAATELLRPQFVAAVGLDPAD
ncbi:MAG: SGNH hydrolase domain-containing protein [Acidimicrobiales bacterium]